jgi:hypothetical protein
MTKFNSDRVKSGGYITLNVKINLLPIVSHTVLHTKNSIKGQWVCLDFKQNWTSCVTCRKKRVVEIGHVFPIIYIFNAKDLLFIIYL